MTDRFVLETDQLTRISTGLSGAGDDARAVLAQIRRLHGEVAGQGGLAARALGHIDAAGRRVEKVSADLRGLGQDVAERGRLITMSELQFGTLQLLRIPGVDLPPIDITIDLPGAPLPPIDFPTDTPGVPGMGAPPIDKPIDVPGLPGLGAPPIDKPIDVPGIPGLGAPPIDKPIDVPGLPGLGAPPIDSPVDIPGLPGGLLWPPIHILDGIPGVPGWRQPPLGFPVGPELGRGGIVFSTPNQDENAPEQPDGDGDGEPVDGNPNGEPGDGETNGGPYAPPRELPRDPVSGDPLPDPEAEGPHTQLGTRRSRSGRGPETYPQAREFDENGNPVRDIDWTDHGRPYIKGHTIPHQHVYDPQTGGRGKAEPLPPFGT